MKDAACRDSDITITETVSPTVTVTVTVTVVVALRHPSLSHWQLHCSARELTESDSCQLPEARPGCPGSSNGPGPGFQPRHSGRSPRPGRGPGDG